MAKRHYGAASHMYYSYDASGHTIHSASFDLMPDPGFNGVVADAGSNAQQFGLDVDSVNGKVYFGAYKPASGYLYRIMSCSLGGADLGIVIDDIPYLKDLKVSPDAGKIMYAWRQDWIYGDSVSTASLDGSNSGQIAVSTTTASSLFYDSIAYSDSRSKIYFVKGSPAADRGKLMRMDIDGQNVEYTNQRCIFSGGADLNFATIDDVNGKAYWIVDEGVFTGSLDIQPSPVTMELILDGTTGGWISSQLDGIAVDPYEERLYYSCQTNNRGVYYCALTGAATPGENLFFRDQEPSSNRTAQIALYFPSYFTYEEELDVLRNISRSSESKFVSYTANEEDTKLYNRNTGNITTTSATINSGSLQSFDVGDGKVKLLFKVEDS